MVTRRIKGLFIGASIITSSFFLQGCSNKLLVPELKELPYQSGVLTTRDSFLRITNTGVSLQDSIITVRGKTFEYKSVPKDQLQQFIDENPSVVALDHNSLFNPYDNKGSFFVGHDYGGFSVLQSARVGDPVTVTTPAESYEYVVESIIQLSVHENNGIQTVDKPELLKALFSYQEKEGITLQTCTKRHPNGSFELLILFCKTS